MMTYQPCDGTCGEARFWRWAAFISMALLLICIVALGYMVFSLMHANWVMENLRGVIDLMQIELFDCNNGG